MVVPIDDLPEFHNILQLFEINHHAGDWIGVAFHGHFDGESLPRPWQLAAAPNSSWFSRSLSGSSRRRGADNSTRLVTRKYPTARCRWLRAGYNIIIN